MNKIPAVAVLAILTFPAFAEELSEEIIETQTPVQEIYAAESHNPKAKFPHGLQLGLGVSATSGLNGFVGYANKDFDSFWWKRLGARFDFATTSPIKSTINSAIDSALDGGVDVGDGLTINGGSLSGKHMAALVDFYPFGNTWFLGGIRLTGGYMFGSTNLAATLTGELSGLPSDEFAFEIDGVNYKYTGNHVDARAKLDWKYSGPYFGTGFDLGLVWGIKIFMDTGVVFASAAPSAGLDIPLNNLQVSHDGGGTWNNVDNPTLEAELETAKANALRDANDELGKIKIYPMIKFGFMYRF